MGLTDTEMDEICNLLDINEEDYDTLMEKELLQIPNKKGKPVTRQHIAKYLNILDNVLELKYYEASNLMWKVKYDDIPDQI